MDFLTFRMNETLIGRLVVAKRKGTDNNMSVEIQPSTAIVQSTVLPDVKFKSIDEWLNHIKQENALRERQQNEAKQSREIMKDNIDYYQDWLTDKFLKIQ